MTIQTATDEAFPAQLEADAQGLALLRDEIRQLLHERELREAIMRSWPPFPQAVQ